MVAIVVAGLCLAVGGVAAARTGIRYFVAHCDRLNGLGHTLHVLAYGHECVALSRFTPSANPSGIRVLTNSCPRVAGGASRREGARLVGGLADRQPISTLVPE